MTRKEIGAAVDRGERFRIYVKVDDDEVPVVGRLYWGAGDDDVEILLANHQTVVTTIANVLEVEELSI